MKIIIKQVSGGECTLEVFPTTSVLDIKREVAQKLHVPVDQQKLILLGRTLADNKTVQSFHIMKEGSKVNLLVKKPESYERLFKVVVRFFFKSGRTEKEAKETANNFMNIVERKFYEMSLDDFNRFAKSALEFEKRYYGEEVNSESDNADNDADCDDTYGL